MSSTTENLGLTLPDATDFYDVGVTNINMSLIDSAVGQIADTGAKETSVQSIITKVGTTTDTGGTTTTGTVMGKLNAIQNNVNNTAEEYATVNITGNPTRSTPLTLTINGGGKLCGVYAYLGLNYSAITQRNELELVINADNETILTHSARTNDADHTFSSSSTIMFGIPDIVDYNYDSTSYFILQPVQSLATRTNGSAQVFGQSTVAETTQSNSSQSRVSLITNPIKFDQNVTITLSTTDHDSTSNCTLKCVYLLD